MDSSRHGRLDGRVALVTGGAGGIGAASALRLAEEGATVVIADRDAEGAERVAASLRAKGLPADAVALDQTDPAQVAAMFDGPLAAHDRLDVCFANAGWGRVGAFLDVPETDWRRHVEINLTGTFLVCQAAARRMVERGDGGSIIVNTSNGAVAPAALFAAYCSTKAALNMLVQVMAGELGGYDIRVNAVMPGVTATGMTREMLATGIGELIEAETPMGRVGRPEDVAAAVAYLASDDSAYVTGTAQLVDGGATHLVPRWFGTDYRRRGAPDWRLRHTAVDAPGGAS
ncbi:SDR family oxidoreductase [Spirillospora sp. NBC_00431]